MFFAMVESYSIEPEALRRCLTRFKLKRLRRISLATLPRCARRGENLNTFFQPPAGGRIRSKVIKCDAYGVATMNGRRGGFINIKRYVQ